MKSEGFCKTVLCWIYIGCSGQRHSQFFSRVHTAIIQIQGVDFQIQIVRNCSQGSSQSYFFVKKFSIIKLFITGLDFGWLLRVFASVVLDCLQDFESLRGVPKLAHLCLGKYTVRIVSPGKVVEGGLFWL